MMSPFARIVWAVSLVLPLLSLSLAHDTHQGKRHHVYRQDDLARRGSDISCQGSRFTFFADGLGACGQNNQPSDFIVALNSAQFNLNLCFQTITITIGGVSHAATITDECPGCPYCGLDFSQGLFESFGALSLGVLDGDWVLGSGGSSPSPSSAPPPPPSTTSVDTPTPSWSPSPTPTSQPPPTSSSSTTTSSSTTAGLSSSSMVPTQTASNSVTEPSGVIPGETTASSVLQDLDLYLVLFAGLLESCSSSQ